MVFQRKHVLSASSRRRELIFEGWNTQEDGHGVSIRNADDLTRWFQKTNAGQIKLYASGISDEIG